ncbi:uncharacterized protein LOC120342189 [Styela clava]
MGCLSYGRILKNRYIQTIRRKMTQVEENCENLIQAFQEKTSLANKVFQEKPNERVTSFSSRKDSETSDLSLSDDSENEQSSTANKNEIHYVKSAKVLGIHKQDRPKVNYLYVLIVKWSDRSQVTIYRKWKEIKELQDNLLTVAKNNKSSETKRYLKKTTRRVRSEARFAQGTMQKLKMIDGLNNFFESVTHFEDLSHSNDARRFFKPNDRDLSSTSWSGDGRTYFYITRDVLCERNNAYVADDQSDVIENDPENNWILASQSSVESENSEDSLTVALDIAYEPDPNITWPIKSSVHVAICEYKATEDDKKENIISLEKDEEVDVLDRNESGWWLVSRINENNPSDKAPECGYVPSDYLQAIEREDAFSDLLSPDSVFDRENSYEYDPDVDESSICSSEGDADDEQPAKTTNTQKTTQTKLSKSSPSLSDSSSDSAFEENEFKYTNKNHAKLILLRNGHTPGMNKRHSLPAVHELTESTTEEESSSPSLSNSTESLNSPIKSTKLYKKRRQRNKSHVVSPLAESGNGVPSLGPRTRSSGTSGVGSRLKSHAARRSTLVNMHNSALGVSMPNVFLPESQSKLSTNAAFERRSTLGNISALHFCGSMPDVHGRSFSNSPILSTISRSSSNLSAANRVGMDYISTKEYEANNADELSFEEGAIITVYRRNPNGWWLASYQGKNGLVPGVNLKKYNDPLRRLSLHVFEML